MLYYDKTTLVCLLFSCLGSIKMIDFVTICFANFRKFSDSLPITHCFWPIISLQCPRGSKSFFSQCCLHSVFPNFNFLYYTLCFAVVNFLCDSFPYGIAFNSILGIEKIQSVTSVPSRTGCVPIHPNSPGLIIWVLNPK